MIAYVTTGDLKVGDSVTLQLMLGSKLVAILSVHTVKRVEPSQFHIRLFPDPGIDEVEF